MVELSMIDIWVLSLIIGTGITGLVILIRDGINSYLNRNRKLK